MTSRQRVHALLNEKKPGALAFGWGGCETAGMHVLVYHRLRRVLGLPPAPAKVDTFMFNAVVPPEVLSAMGADLMLVASPLMCARPLHQTAGWHEVTLWGEPMLLTDNQRLELSEDGGIYLLSDGVRIARCPKEGLYFDALDVGSWADAQAMPSPADYHPETAFSDEFLRALEEAAKQAYEATEFALNCGETLPDLQLMPGGMLNWYEAMLTEPDLAGEFLEKNVDAALKKLTGLHQAVGKYCAMLSIAHDLGDNRGVTIGDGLFRRIYKPHYKRLFTKWREITSMKVNLHSCGSIRTILPDLIECGVDVLNPVQISAAGMEPAGLAEDFGQELIFYGGAYDAVQLPPDTPAEKVYDQVLKNIQALSKNGPYLFAAVHNTPADTPDAHIEAILAAWGRAKELSEA